MAVMKWRATWVCSLFALVPGYFQLCLIKQEQETSVSAKLTLWQAFYLHFFYYTCVCNSIQNVLVL